VESDVSHLRTEYDAPPLEAERAGADPMALFAEWFDLARTRDPQREPNAMTLATAAADGTPSARMVLLKGIDPARAAFTWFTNLESRKAREALGRGRAALCWWWPGSPGRQVRAVGVVETVSREDAAAYFAQRPLAARIGATASAQSRPIATRAELDAHAEELRVVSGDAGPELPEQWGGLRLVADELEFWQGRAGRLHDRIAFLRVDPGTGELRSRAAAEHADLLAAGTRVQDPSGTSWLRVRLQP
jgi:pyridoxamine 5'-phosphate oxidase